MITGEPLSAVVVHLQYNGIRAKWYCIETDVGEWQSSTVPSGIHSKRQGAMVSLAHGRKYSREKSHCDRSVQVMLQESTGVICSGGVRVHGSIVQTLTWVQMRVSVAIKERPEPSAEN